jgi:hypothetical protein
MGPINCMCKAGQKNVKGTVSRDFFSSGFFHESVSSQPQSIPLRLFQIFSKIHGDIRKSRCTTGINDTGGKIATVITKPSANFSTIFANVVDNGGKFAMGVNNTGGKFASGVNDAGGKLSPVSMTPAASMSPVSTTLVTNLEL